MNLKTCRESYYEFSGKLSDNSRKLTFAGIAIVWIFKQEPSGVCFIPHLLKTAMLIFVISLSLDLFQYIYQTIIWGIFHAYKEKKLNNDENADFLAPPIFNLIANIIYWLKILALVVGYVFMLKHFNL